MDSENEVLTPPEIRAAAEAASLDLLPKKSRNNYEIAYNNFMDWRSRNKATSFSEDTLLVYFKELAKKYKSSSLWTFYSMLKSTLYIKHNVKIDHYAKLHALLKRQSEGYQPKKSKAFTGQEINKFIYEAPDTKYLATKVALIMGVMGACRSNELHAMKIQHVTFYEGCTRVIVPVTKTKIPRNFTITEKFHDIVKKYANLRLPNASDSFFMNFQNGKCTKQVIGINKFAKMGREIASFLQIKNPERYTGHCLRRSSATLYVDAGASMTALKRHGGWKSASVAEGYIADSQKNKTDAATKILSQINPNCNINNSTFVSTPSQYPGMSTITSESSHNTFSISKDTTDISIGTTPTTMNFNNCPNITINFMK
ncbi:uncharacterized protein LOC132708080 [Cylas formicarius]|uniref:uncharacterized protein LOC132696080 n=1 Tax=Cylas formicarius TaxID=197179 RepID=UPI0029584033|nr:uncharacterized protein LOC132696080 [Cylas formicarius]XP_060517301.1 uncharacterized protein LOC132696479 [Cylas formicarius]XP_060517314.1 uncharacterized protein LOC132696487 [Cylas formicarius]XP_060518282.1 uncharacterized protein LOC132697045 [Cylas formicarius]XP_060518927.1 uncharacterized protein LOC132697428 [Cylas formicarius]XP_060521739.1 uncharacterized protein LOC132699182 [Cylas formicarius]XP_060521909.1 uncharacterized protein LOC132699291 [Cylas formicarius]XP_06052348